MLSNNLKIKHTADEYHIYLAYSFFNRARGLLFRKKLMSNECLLISPCSSIHTIGMFYSLDIVFLDACGIIVEVYEDVKPFRFISSSHKRARTVVEFKGGCLKNLDIKLNDHLFETGIFNLEHE
ncbi:DUF192 domain-containing protein [Acinetobacter nectaris]|uniref:DUF192 domain-containing protein n=1 Tax=Acinetobacter nectaris TaxID=1219382 RepID=UPI0023511C2D|nr:DUF192 domain-containing protein [Acinetobacter nectaris]MCF9047103.1 DUF192 domain-containing protein [Acinetobacter nectaris]